MKNGILSRRVAAHVLAGSLLLATPPVRAQETTAPPPCSGPEHRQFDFWVGEWDVTQPDGTPAGTNRIEIILVKQHWRTSTDGGRSWTDAFVGIYTRK